MLVLDHVALHGRMHQFGVGEGRTLLDNVMCTGNETSILNCNSNELFQQNCAEDHSEDAAVVCESN